MSHDRVIREASRKQTAVFTFSKTYPAYIVLALALVASVVVYRVVADKVESDKTAAFEKATASVVARLNTAVNNHMQIIRSMRGLYQSFPFVVRDVFELYGSIPVKTYPSLQAVSFTQPVPAGELGSFVYFAQSERYYTYRVTPQSDTFSLYYPVFYTVPLERNESLVGYNLAASPVVLATIDRALQRKDYTASPVLTLPNTEKPSFVLMVPVEKHESGALEVRGHEVSGMLFVQILAEEFFRTAVGTGVASDTSIAFWCYDTTDADTRVYSSANAASVDLATFTPAYTQTVSIPLADRAFSVQFATVPGFGGGFQNNLPVLSLLGGIVSSFLLFAFTLSTLTSRARAQDIAERMTRSQRRIVDTSRDMIGIVGLDGVIHAMNPAALAVLGYTPEEMIGRKVEEFLHPEDRETVRNLLVSSTAGEQQVAYEVRMVTKDGDIRWVSWNDTISRTDGLVYCIGRDSTERRRAEDEIRLRTKQIDLARQHTAESVHFKSEFMSNVSFYFRTSLTGIIGYLQLVKAGMYSTPEERDSYVDTAYQSAEDLLSRVGDLLDVAEGSNEGRDTTRIESLPLEKTFSDIFFGFAHSNGHKRDVELHSDNTDGYLVYGDRVMLQHIMGDVLGALNDGQGGMISATLQVNPHENVVDVQVLTPPNPRVTELIEVARSASTQEAQLDALRRDRDDVIFRIAAAMSRAKMINGHMVIETLGPEGNVVILTLPVKKLPSLKKNRHPSTN